MSVLPKPPDMRYMFTIFGRKWFERITRLFPGTVTFSGETTSPLENQPTVLQLSEFPVGMIALKGDRVRFECHGTFLNSANNKQVYVQVGLDEEYTTIYDTTELGFSSAADESFIIEGSIIRTSNEELKCGVRLSSDSSTKTADAAITTISVDLSTTTLMQIRVVGYSGSGTDIDCELLRVSLEPGIFN